MTNITALIPIKGQNNKSRLSCVLSGTQRQSLSEWMLARTLTAVTASEKIQNVRLIGSDLDAQSKALAKASHVTFAVENQNNLNAALQQEFDACVRASQAVLVLFADLPWITPQVVADFVCEGLDHQSDLMLAPDASWNGTNALFYRGQESLLMVYGPNSFQNFLHQARRAGIHVAALQHKTLMRDLDTAHDWQQWQSDLKRLGLNLENIGHAVQR